MLDMTRLQCSFRFTYIDSNHTKRWRRSIYSQGQRPWLESGEKGRPEGPKYTWCFSTDIGFK